MNYFLHADYPGYVYDEERHCYFRVPPKHFKQYSQHDKAHSDPGNGSMVEPVKSSGVSLHSFLQKQKINDVHSLRYIVL